MQKEMTFLEHLDELRSRLIRIIASVAVLSLFFFLFGVKEAAVGGYRVFYPFPDVYDNISAMVLRQIEHDLLPPGVKLITTEPAQMMIVTIYASLFLGLIFSMPVVVYELGKFVNPALFVHERRVLSKVLIPSVILFVLGAVFAYYLMIPFILQFLLGYALVSDVAAYLTIESFMSFIFWFLIAMGLAFQLPIFMVGLTSVGAVQAETWKHNFRYAVVAISVFGAAVTPDGSGVTMSMVAAPMILLYALGYLIARGQKPKIG